MEDDKCDREFLDLRRFMSEMTGSKYERRHVKNIDKKHYDPYYGVRCKVVKEMSKDNQTYEYAFIVVPYITSGRIHVITITKKLPTVNTEGSLWLLKQDSNL